MTSIALNTKIDNCKELKKKDKLINQDMIAHELEIPSLQVQLTRVEKSHGVKCVF